MKELNDIVKALEEVAEQIEFLRTTTGESGYTIAESLEIIALTMLQQKEKGQ